MSDRYQIQEKVGQGGLGAVYRAFDTQLKREVALKRILTPEQANAEDVADAAEKLMKEATVMSSLNHPNIVTVFDIGQDESGGFVVMELLDGETLDETVGRGLLTLHDFSEVVNQTLEALIAAQAVNMLHRDLKPGNVMVIWRASGKFQIKVLDFGLAKISASPSVQTIDQGDAILGSIYFMAPEQFERLKLDFRTDLYAMGAIYYFSLTGKYPFDGETAPQVMAAHLQHKVKPLKELRPDLPDEVCQWVMWLINRDMKRRPADAREALERFPPIAGSSSGPVQVAQEEIATAILVEDEPEAKTVNPSTGRMQIGNSPRMMKTGPQPTAKAATGRTSAQAGRSITGGVTTTSQTGQISSHSATVELAYQQEAQKKRKGILIGSLVSATILIALGTVFLLGKMADARSAERMANLASDSQGTAEDVQLVIRFLDPSNSDPRALRVLKDLEGPGVYDAILKALSEATPGRVRMYIMDTVASRNMPEAFSDVLRIFGSSADPKERSIAAKTLQIIARDENLNELMAMLAKRDIATTDRTILEDTVIAILRTDSNIESRVMPVLNGMAPEPSAYRKSLCRILGSLGGKAALSRLERIFKEEDAQYQADAILALNQWPDKSAQRLIQEIIETSENQAVKTAATRAYTRILSLPGQGMADTGSWKRAMENVSSSDKQRVFGLMVDRPFSQTVDFLKQNTFPGMEALQKRVIQEIEKKIAVMPSVKSGQLIKAADGELRGEPGGAFLNRNSGRVENWTSPETFIQWAMKVDEPGTYVVEILQSCESLAGSQLEFISQRKSLSGKVVTTSSWDNFKAVKLGTPPEIVIAPGDVGPQIFFLRAGKVVQRRIADIEGVRLTKK